MPPGRMLAQYRHSGDDRWYLESLGIGAAGAVGTNRLTMRGLSMVGDNWNTKAGRDIIWRSRARQTPATAGEDHPAIRNTPMDELPRYFRAFDFLSGDEKNSRDPIACVLAEQCGGGQRTRGVHRLPRPSQRHARLSISRSSPTSSPRSTACSTVPKARCSSSRWWTDSTCRTGIRKWSRSLKNSRTRRSPSMWRRCSSRRTCGRCCRKRCGRATRSKPPPWPVRWATPATIVPPPSSCR